MDKEFIVDSDNRDMFEMFCHLHPIEAYDLNMEAFLEYMYREYPQLSRDEI